MADYTGKTLSQIRSQVSHIHVEVRNAEMMPAGSESSILHPRLRAGEFASPRVVDSRLSAIRLLATMSSTAPGWYHHTTVPLHHHCLARVLFASNWQTSQSPIPTGWTFAIDVLAIVPALLNQSFNEASTHVRAMLSGVIAPWRYIQNGVGDKTTLLERYNGRTYFC